MRAKNRFYMDADIFLPIFANRRRTISAHFESRNSLT